MKKNIITLIAASVITLSAFVFMGQVAHANPSFFLAPVSTSAATSTVSQIIPGVATTTLVFDSQLNGRPYTADVAVLLIRATASSTSSVVNVDYQFSQNGIDWYGNNLDLPTATSTHYLAALNTSTWSFTSTATTSHALTLPVPTRYVKTVISATGANSFIYASIIPKQEAL